MYLKNKTNGTIVLAEVIGTQDVVVPANGISENFNPTEELLEKFLINQESLELHATRGAELKAAAEIDPRVETLMILD